MWLPPGEHCAVKLGSRLSVRFSKLHNRLIRGRQPEKIDCILLSLDRLLLLLLYFLDKEMHLESDTVKHIHIEMNITDHNSLV